MSLSLNQPAPDFTLFSTEKQPISLSSFRGQKVVLYFYPGAFSGGCTKELCAIRDDMASYNQLNAKVIGISTDSVFTIAKFKKTKYYVSCRYDPSEGWFGFNSSGWECPSQQTNDFSFKYWIYSFFGFLIGFGVGDKEGV